MKTKRIPFTVEDYQRLCTETPFHVETREGLPVRVICLDLKGAQYPVIALIDKDKVEAIIHYTANGKYYYGGDESEYDLFLIVPARSLGWVNVYKYAETSAVHPTREKADSAALSNRLACVEIFEGDGLENCG
ncbi:hypothetical protein DYU11_20220 [Fibrisoma montanum]|uniref:Uncharacterized protein n=1 Tax=Fibrisoma montanum TaxID=2305895 RepID=A0A418M3T6_9BACT|nr:hypothetical protein [Fibrisoma montanum]RIV20379.1 hypothetical protein DYU11_20220 [Fibrisoma montanum]